MLHNIMYSLRVQKLWNAKTTIFQVTVYDFVLLKTEIVKKIRHILLTWDLVNSTYSLNKNYQTCLFVANSQLL